MTDDATYYRSIGGEFKYHFTVEHGIGEYVRGGAHTNTIEGLFQHLQARNDWHLSTLQFGASQRYLAEFDFRYNHRIALGIDDMARTNAALGGIVGKRLTYR
jgi:ISXO2-like transposase domain